MSAEKKEEPKKADGKEGAEGAPKKKGPLGVVVGVVLSAVLAGGAAYGGARAASGGHAPKEPPKPKFHPPGPTVPLEPFIANLPDTDGKNHAVKVTIAIELVREAQEDQFKIYIPRVRDVTLTYIRGLTFNQIVEKDSTEKMRRELIEKWHAIGATDANQVLITDLITQ